MLGWVVAAPVLVTAARVDRVAGAPRLETTSSPVAARTLGAVDMLPIPSPDQPADVTDLGDYLIMASKPTNWMITVTVQSNGQVDFVMPREENGQGLRTGVAMIIAEELDVALSSVNVTLADADPALVFNQITGGSSGIRTLWDPVRAACAIARQQLLEAAADELGVPISSLSVSDGVVSASDGQSLTYGQLSPLAAATETEQVQATPKPSSEYTIIGTPVPQLANRDIVTGREVYATDLDIPGALPTMVRRPPTIKGTLKSFTNYSTIRNMPGIHDVVAMPFGVAVRGETFGQVIDAVNAVQATWNPGPVANMDDASVYAQLEEAAIGLPASSLPSLPLGARLVEADFRWAFVNHAPLEPNVAVADVRSDRAEIWAPLQNPIVTLQQIAQDVGLPQSDVTVHVIRGGGSFGRTLWFDAAQEAAQISKAMGKPVKLMWHRTNDMRVGRAHPQSYHKLQAVVLGGSVLGYLHRLATVQADVNPGLGEIISYTTAKPDLGMEGYDEFLFTTTVVCPYNFGVVAELLTEVPLDFWTSSWRSVYNYDTRGSEEMFVDQLAAAMGQDPLAFRLAFLKSDTSKALLQSVAKAGNWGRTMPEGTAQGISIERRDKSATACLVELDATDPAKPRVTNAWIAADARLPVNPLSIEGQLMGGLSDAISVVLSAGNRIQDGLPLEDGWDGFGWARQGQNPVNLTITVNPLSADVPGGIGEIGVSTAVGAIGNAYARATGTLPRTFPVNPAPLPSDLTPPGQLSPPPSQPVPFGQLYDY